MSEGNPRRPRVAQAIREALGDLIRDELSDPRIRKAGFVSINHVELNKDMGVAHVYIAFYGGDDRAALAGVTALSRAAGRLRGPLGRSLNLQRAPELRFQHDKSGEFGMRLSEIIRHDEDLRQETGPVEEEPSEAERPDEVGGSVVGPESDELATDEAINVGAGNVETFEVGAGQALKKIGEEDA